MPSYYRDMREYVRRKRTEVESYEYYDDDFNGYAKKDVDKIEKAKKSQKKSLFSFFKRDKTTTK